MHTNCLVFSGHLPDLDREKPRFTTAMLPATQAWFSQWLSEIEHINSYDCVISAAAGADILFAETAYSLGCTLHIFLPCPAEMFANHSIKPYENDGNDWEIRFNKLMAKATVHIENFPLKDNHPDFAACNQVMVNFATQNYKNIVPVVFLQGDNAPKPGGTQDFEAIFSHLGKKVTNLYDPKLDPAKLHLGSEELSRWVPSFDEVDRVAIENQTIWQTRLRNSMLVLAAVIVLGRLESLRPDDFWGYAPIIKTIGLITVIIGAILETSHIPHDKVRLRDWITSRARAEQIRNFMWQYLFNLDLEGRHRVVSLHDFEEFLRRIGVITVRINKDEPELSKLILLSQPLAIRKTIYMKFRLHDQAAYFNRKSAQLKRKVRNFQRARMIMLITGILWGISRLYFAFFGHGHEPEIYESFNLLAVVVSLVVIIAGYQKSMNMEDLAFKYEQMYKRLKEEEKELHEAKDNESFHTVIYNTEELLRSQNNEWVVNRETAKIGH